MELKTDAELIQEYVLNKSERAAYAIVKRYKNYVFAIALRFSHSYDEAEDISQEAFLKIFKKLHSFEGKSTFKTWIYRITVNTFLNIRKKRNINTKLTRDTTIDLDDFQNNFQNPEQELEYKELYERIMKVLLLLPKKQREVFSLRFFDQMKYEEMSKLLGKTTGGLKANYYHAIRKIIELLK